MRIICASEKGGCGRAFELTNELLAAFFKAEMDGSGMECPNPSCHRYYSGKHVAKVLSAARERAAEPEPEPTPEPVEVKKVPPTKSLKAIGAQGLLTTADLSDLSAAKKRVAKLMSDGAWHTADAIKLAAGENGVEASEGLRRMRELRQINGIDVEKQKIPGSKRQWRYRLIRKAGAVAGVG